MNSSNIVNALPIGTLLHGANYVYKVEKLLGQGTFGITYLASVKMSGALGSIDTEIHVAIKEFFMKDVNGRDDSTVTSSNKNGTFQYYKSKFIKEACNLGKLTHPNIIKVIESFEENNTAYYAMEYVNGGSLDELIAANGGLSQSQTKLYALQIAEALKYMHSKNIVHLDLKPNNIMLNHEEQIVLIDFGLSKQFDANGVPESSTSIGHGTPGYSPVEQANYNSDSSNTFPATMDIYAFGATIFKMVTGHRPPEASFILNEGFPKSELFSHNCSQDLAVAIIKCMAPLKKDRYQTIIECIESLSVVSESYNAAEEETAYTERGFYKQKFQQSKNGPYIIREIPVSESIKFPEEILIKVWSKNRKGLSYELLLTDWPDKEATNASYVRFNIAKVWNDGLLVSEHHFRTGISDDVKAFLINHGFLSTHHWERESTTTQMGEEFGYHVSVRMIDRNKNEFIRQVSNAHHDYHNLLLNEVEDLVRNTCLWEEIKPERWEKNYQTETEPYSVFKAPAAINISQISVTFSPSFGYRALAHGGFTYSVFSDAHHRNGIDIRALSSLVKEINDLRLKVGKLMKFDPMDYSEPCANFRLNFVLKGGKSINLSLDAFNRNIRCGGNIYDIDIYTLAESVKRIFIKYLPESTTKKRPAIYTIPHSTSEIEINYRAGGAVGLDKSISFRIGCNKMSLVHSDEEYIYSPSMFKKLKEGLNSMQLHSKDRMYEEASTGQTFPTLTILLYDEKGDLTEEFYAQDQGIYQGGNIAIPVAELRNNIIKIHPYFGKLFGPKAGAVSKGAKALYPGSLLIIVTLALGLLALPLSFFVKPTDILYRWLWISIFAAELFCGIISFLLNRFLPVKYARHLEFISLLVGIVSVIIYIILWIIQIFLW